MHFIVITHGLMNLHTFSSVFQLDRFVHLPIVVNSLEDCVYAMWWRRGDSQSEATTRQARSSTAHTVGATNVFNWRMILCIEDAVAVYAFIDSYCRGCRQTQPITGDHDCSLPNQRGILMD